MLKGQSFCSLEHQELHFGLSFERLRASVDEQALDKVNPEQFAPKQSRENPFRRPAKLEPPQPEAVQTEPAVEPERVVVPEQVVEPQGKTALEEASPTLGIANLMESVGKSTGVDLPEAPFLPELPSPQIQAASALKSDDAESIPAAVHLPVKPAVGPERVVVPEQVVEPQGKTALEEASPTLDIANLMESVGKSTGVDLPEAPFLLELPSPQIQAASALKSDDAESIPAAVHLPVSPARPSSLRTSPSVVLDASPTQSPVEATPAANQPTWLFVPQGYPPVMVSASTTQVLDSSGAELMALPIGEPCSGVGPPPPPQTDAIETSLRQPRLPSWRTGLRPVSVPALLVRPPLASACDTSWKGRLGPGPALPPLGGILRPQRDLARLVPSVGSENFAALSRSSFCNAPPASPVLPPKEHSVSPGAPITPTIIPRQTVRSEQTPSTSRGWALAAAPGPRALESTAPLRCELSSRAIHATWLQIAVASRLPQAAIILPPATIGLSLAADAVSLGCSSVSTFPPAAETVAAVMSAPPLLVLFTASSIDAPAMPLWSSSWPLWCQSYRLPSPVREQQYALSAAYLHHSSPSPLSLVTWSQSLGISIPACNPSNLAIPAQIGVSAIQGSPVALRLSAPNRRAYQLTPLMPQPNGIASVPVAPTQAPLRPPSIKPIRPGSEGTAPPRLAGIRVQPSSMPALPLASRLFGIERVTGLAVLGPSSGGTLKTAYIDIAHDTLSSASDLRTESNTVLPSFSAERHAPAIGPAPCSHRVWWDAMPPDQNVITVQTFSALQRLAWSLTAYLPSAA